MYVVHSKNKRVHFTNVRSIQLKSFLRWHDLQHRIEGPLKHLPIRFCIGGSRSRQSNYWISTISFTRRNVFVRGEYCLAQYLSRQPHSGGVSYSHMSKPTVTITFLSLDY